MDLYTLFWYRYLCWENCAEWWQYHGIHVETYLSENQQEFLAKPLNPLPFQLIPRQHCGAEQWRSPPHCHPGTLGMKSALEANKIEHEKCGKNYDWNQITIIKGGKERRTLFFRLCLWALSVRLRVSPGSSSLPSGSWFNTGIWIRLASTVKLHTHNYVAL